MWGFIDYISYFINNAYLFLQQFFNTLPQISFTKAKFDESNFKNNNEHIELAWKLWEKMGSPKYICAPM
eukprot:Pgem_evm1s8477